MLPEEALVRFRSEVDDLVEPYLWSDELVLGYIGEAEVEFCRKTDGIADASTVPVTRITLVANTEWYALHASILKIRSAYRIDTGAPVTVLNAEDMPSRGMRWDGRAGQLSALVIGIEDRKVRTWPVPNETPTIQLSVFRTPVTPVSVDNDAGPFEVEAKHHASLLHWVKHLAYSKQDAETFDRTKAQEFERKFEAYCFDQKLEQRKLRHKPRAIAYGGL